MQEDRVHPRPPDNVLVIWRRSKGKLLPSLIRPGEHCAVSFTSALTGEETTPAEVDTGCCIHCLSWDWSPSSPKMSWEQPVAVPWLHDGALGIEALILWYLLAVQGLGPAPRTNVCTLSIGRAPRICLSTCQQALSRSLLIYSDISFHWWQSFWAA